MNAAARCSFVAVTTTDLARAKAFWSGALGFRVTEESAGEHFIVDAGGLRLCVDRADGDVHRPGSTDPVVGLLVPDVEAALRDLASRGVRAEKGPVLGSRGRWALLRDPDGHGVVLAEFE